MNTIRCDLPTHLDRLEIYPISDIHLGSKECNIKEFDEQIDYILRTPNCYTVLLGDLIENATTNSVGDTYSSTSPMDQIRTIVDKLSPIKDKILCAVDGNHEGRSAKSDGLQIGRFICAELGVNYDPISQLMFVRFGNDVKNRPVCYSIYCIHGSSSGKGIGAKATGLERIGNVVSVDCVICGHTHQNLAFSTMYFEVDKNHSTIREKQCMHVNAGSTLNYKGSYAERMSLKPSSRAKPIIILNGNNHKVEVKIQ